MTHDSDQTHWNQFFRRAFAATGVAVMLTVPASAETVIKFATTIPGSTVMMQSVYQPWIDALNEAGKGEFVVIAQDATFASQSNVWDRVGSGVAEMGFSILPNTGLPFDRVSVSMLPGLGQDTEAGSVALWRLFERGMLGNEFDDVKLLNLVSVPANVLVAKNPITRMEDMAGLKVRVMDRRTADAMKALGASPVALPPAEVYQAISNGLVDATLANSSSIIAYRYSEVMTAQVSNMSFGMLPTAIYMNKDAYESLSPEGRAIMDSFNGEKASRELGRAYMALDESNYRKLAEEAEGYVFTELPPEELARWQKAVLPVIDNWIAATPKGDEILSAYQEEYAKALEAKD